MGREESQESYEEEGESDEHQNFSSPRRRRLFVLIVFVLRYLEIAVCSLHAGQTLRQEPGPFDPIRFQTTSYTCHSIELDSPSTSDAESLSTDVAGERRAEEENG